MRLPDLLVQHSIIAIQFFLVEGGGFKENVRTILNWFLTYKMILKRYISKKVSRKIILDRSRSGNRTDDALHINGKLHCHTRFWDNRYNLWESQRYISMIFIIYCTFQFGATYQQLCFFVTQVAWRINLLL